MRNLSATHIGRLISNDLALSSIKSVTRALRPASLGVALLLSLTALGACAADDLADGGLRMTPEELIWKPGRVPGHEIAPPDRRLQQTGAVRRARQIPRQQHFAGAFPSEKPDVHRHFRHRVRRLRRQIRRRKTESATGGKLLHRAGQCEPLLPDQGRRRGGPDRRKWPDRHTRACYGELCIEVLSGHLRTTSASASIVFSPTGVNGVAPTARPGVACGTL